MTPAQLAALIAGEASIEGRQETAPTAERGTAADLLAMRALVP